MTKNSKTLSVSLSWALMVGGAVFNGQIDELQILDDALNSEEVQLLFSSPQIHLVYARGFGSGDTSSWSNRVQ